MNKNTPLRTRINELKYHCERMTDPDLVSHTKNIIKTLENQEVYEGVYYD